MIKELLKRIRDGAISVEERTARHFERIEKKDKDINAFISLNKKEVMEKAREIDKRVKKGERVGKLAGLLVGVKDNLCVQGLKCTCASKMLANWVAPYDAAVVRKIKEEDGIILGKTNLDEFAGGSTTEHSYFGPTRNPHDLSRVPGGSSGGSAAAVAADFCDLALGSDTGSSIRLPAAFCGVVGLKPSYGLTSRYGLIDLAMSLENPGPFAKDVYGCALLTSVIAGHDPQDNVTVDWEKKNYTKSLRKSVKGMKIGRAKEFFEGVDPRQKEVIEKALKGLEDKGAEIIDVSIPSLKYGVPTYFLICYAEFSSAMQKFDGYKYGFRSKKEKGIFDTAAESRDLSLGDEVKRRILLGTYITMKEYRSKWYTTALRARNLIKRDFEKAFKKADVILSPTCPDLPFKIGEKIKDPIKMYLTDRLTTAANLAGICAGVVNAGFVKVNGSKLPVGLQIHGNKFDESTVFRVMKAVEGRLRKLESRQV